MNRTLLLTRPYHDVVTNYLYHWSTPVIKLAEFKKFKLIDLKGAKACKREFQGRLKKLSPSLVFINGHGSEDFVCGQDNEVLADTSTDRNLFARSVIYARACSAAKRFGKYLVEDNASTFIGYDQPFIFLHTIGLTSRPLRDKIAGYFMEPSNMVVEALIKGHSASEANSRSRKQFMDNISKLLTSEATAEETAVVRYLFWNYRHQVCLGFQSNGLRI